MKCEGLNPDVSLFHKKVISYPCLCSFIVLQQNIEFMQSKVYRENKSKQSLILILKSSPMMREILQVILDRDFFYLFLHSDETLW